MFNEATLESFSETDLDIVRLSGTSPADLEADAKSKEVDLLLTEHDRGSEDRRGGIDGQDERLVRRRVFGESGLRLCGARPAQAGVQTVGAQRRLDAQQCDQIAKKVAQFAPPLMMTKYGYMNAYGSMLLAERPSGAMKQSPDPVMNMAFSLLDRAREQAAGTVHTQEAAVASALEKVIKSVVSLGKITAKTAKKANKASRYTAFFLSCVPEW